MPQIALKISFSLVLLAAACGGGQTHDTHGTNPLAPLQLYPLKSKAAWSYDIDTGLGMNTLAISRVTSIRGKLVEVSSGGEPIVYEISEEGIRRPADDTWLLKAPVQDGAQWKSAVGTATVVSLDASIQTPARQFHHCVRIEENNDEKTRVVRTIYCPQIGPVYIDSQMHMQVSGHDTRVVARLLGSSTLP